MRCSMFYHDTRRDEHLLGMNKIQNRKKQEIDLRNNADTIFFALRAPDDRKCGKQSRTASLSRACLVLSRFVQSWQFEQIVTSSHSRQKYRRSGLAMSWLQILQQESDASDPRCCILSHMIRMASLSMRV